MTLESHNDQRTVDLLTSASAGEEAAWGRLLQLDEERLCRGVRLRMDLRLRGRIDAEDVVQEAFITASKRRYEYFSNPNMPFFVWLRLITMQKLAELHRHHLGVKARDATRDISLFSPIPQATSAVLAARLLGQSKTPSQIVAREEVERQVRETLENMEESDREIIALRNFEQLSNGEAAAVLGIGPSTASSRYLRALQKIKATLRSLGIESV